MAKVLRFAGKYIDTEVLGKQINDAFGIFVGGVRNHDEKYHGHISQIWKHGGDPFGITSDGVEIDSCPWCSAEIPRADDHYCSEVVLYEESARACTDKSVRDVRRVNPDLAAAMDRRMIAPHGLDDKGLEALREIVVRHGTVSTTGTAS